MYNSNLLSYDDDASSRRTSLFSGTKPSTMSTRPSTRNTTDSSTSNSKIGQALRVSDNIENKTVNPLERLSEILIQQFENFDSKTPVLISESLNKFDYDPSKLNMALNKKYIKNVLKVVLTLVDTVLVNNETYETARAMILKSFYKFCMHIREISPLKSNLDNLVVPEPQNFCLVDEYDSKISKILDSIASVDSNTILDQEGSFLAPVSRGISEELSIPTIICGFPNPESTHYLQVKQLCTTFNDIHFVVQKNYIKTCSLPLDFALPVLSPTQEFVSASASPISPAYRHAVDNNLNNVLMRNQAKKANEESQVFAAGLAPPFRVPTDPNNIPLSFSIAPNSNSKLSGTLGGYLYPKINIKKNSALKEDAKATYALTCAHVCIEDSMTQPYVSIPSPVLVKLYKEALTAERDKYPVYSQEFKGYNAALNVLAYKFPTGDCESNSVGTFGRVIFGERSIINGRLSDIAIIKCNPHINPMNHLGLDIPFNQYDPALMFGNLQIKQVITKIRPGSSVFKYGSTTKYTVGKLSKPKLVYWEDNKVQSSEFVISGDESGFASGGDSGAWILQKLEEYEFFERMSSTSNASGNRNLGNKSSHNKSNQNEKLASIDECEDNPKSGLGVVGMLHAYDGEFKQFGLYSPMVLILHRLYELTKVPWGIVGVVEDKDEDIPIDSDDSEENSNDNSEDDSNADENEDQQEDDEYDEEYETGSTSETGSEE